MTFAPVDLCRGLLGALDASEGRRKRRARETTADAIGLAIQREILEDAIRDAPAAEDFEQWLLDRCAAQGPADGGHRAMALEIWHQWQLASQTESVREWLLGGAQSADRERT